MKTIVVTIEGVLRKLTDGSRISEGVNLLVQLTNMHDSQHPYNVVFLTHGDAASVEEWLDMCDLSGLVLGAREDRVAQLRRIRHEWGYPIELVLEPDPAIAADLMANGYTTLLWLSPGYSHPEWRPDNEYSMRTWDEIKSSRKKDIHRRTTDVRLSGGTL
jgi:hypothetical protein